MLKKNVAQALLGILRQAEAHISAHEDRDDKSSCSVCVALLGQFKQEVYYLVSSSFYYGKLKQKSTLSSSEEAYLSFFTALEQLRVSIVREDFRHQSRKSLLKCYCDLVRDSLQCIQDLNIGVECAFVWDPKEKGRSEQNHYKNSRRYRGDQKSL